ncbi:hypothetical protein MRX96_029389 [Rhipicephalus microplus]
MPTLARASNTKQHAVYAEPGPSVSGVPWCETARRRSFSDSPLVRNVMADAMVGEGGGVRPRLKTSARDEFIPCYTPYRQILLR